MLIAKRSERKEVDLEQKFLKSEIREINYPYVNLNHKVIKVDFIHQLQNLAYLISGGKEFIFNRTTEFKEHHEL